MPHMLQNAQRAAAEALESLPDESSRRMLLSLGGVAALALLSNRAEAQSQYPPGHEVSVTWHSPLNRLIRRITFGINVTEQSIAGQLGFQGYLERQLSPETINDADTDRVVAGRWPKMAWTEAQLYDDPDGWDQYLQLVYSTVFRSFYSRRLLHERMVEFWTDHFNVSSEKVGISILTSYIQKNIRRHAMGTFGDLLKSTAHSAAMLNFLDNDQNSANQPNINYSRELHELHSMGTDGGYSGKDLHEAALVLSGWTWSSSPYSYNRGRFKFEVDDHAAGSKTVMGQTYAEDGQNEGERMLAFIASHPSTARFITKKLCRFFLGDDFANKVWSDAQSVFLASGGDVRSVLRVILTPNNLMASNARYKKPYHLLMSAMRSAKTRVYDFGPLLWGPLGEAGHVPFGWEPPDGYPDRFEFWAPSQLPRLNTAFRLAGNFMNGVVTDVEATFGSDRTPNGVLQAILRAFFGNEMGAADRSALYAYLTQATITDERLRGAVALAIASPSFQWY